MSEGERKDVGAFWEYRSKSGKWYYSGFVTIDGKRIDLVMFKNDFRKTDKQPTYRVYLSEKKEERGGTSGREEGDWRERAREYDRAHVVRPPASLQEDQPDGVFDTNNSGGADDEEVPF
jgi:uncharacterized protein (DUF736 family)